MTVTHNLGDSPNFPVTLLSLFGSSLGNTGQRVQNVELAQWTPQNRIGGSLPVMNDGDSPAFPGPPRQPLKCLQRNWTGSTAGFWFRSHLSTYMETQRGSEGLGLAIITAH